MSRINRIHEEYHDPDRHGGNPPEPPEAYQTVLDFFSAENEEQCERRIYKYTECGAWIEFNESGIVIGSIVEGCDFGTSTYPLYYADNFTAKDIQDRIDAVEAEADAIWNWCNVGIDKLGRRNPRSNKTAADWGLDCPDVDNAFEKGERSS